MEFAEHRFFLSEWAVNLSPGGMFVRSEAPIVPGQRFHFDAGLTAKGPRFEGVGEVMWVRREWEGNARPPGFAVRFLELQQDGVDAMQQLADVFLDKGVGAMQEELMAMAAAWQRRRLDDESTDEMEAPVEQVETPLPDTAVIQAPWAAGEDHPTAPIAQVLAPPLDGEEGAGAAAVELEREVTAPLVVEPAPPPQEPSGEAPKPPGRRRVWWVGGVALLLAGSAYLVLQGPLAGRLNGVATTDAAAAEAMLATAPRAMPAAARTLAGPTSFGLRDVRWSEDANGLWVMLDVDGVLPPNAVRHKRIEENQPRELIRLVGAHQHDAPTVKLVGSPLLERIRVGFHDEYDGSDPAGDELWVVFDLPSAAVKAREVLPGADGRSVRVLLVRDQAAAAAPPVVPAASAAAASAAAAPSAPAPTPAAAGSAAAPPQ